MKRSIVFGLLSLFVGLGLTLSIVLYHFFYPERYVKLENGNYVSVDSLSVDSPFPIRKDCEIVMEYFYREENRLLSETNIVFPELYGFTKDELNRYLKNYMVTMPAQEKKNGLCSFQLVEYRNNRIVLRKTYSKKKKQGYYAKSINDTIVILNSDEKTVFEYTPILLHTLPKELQVKVQQGYYLQDEKELYDFLENYSS